MGLDFNPAAIEHAESSGFDGKKFQKDVAEWLRPRLARLPTADDRLPATSQWLEEAFEGRLRQWLKLAQENTTALWTQVADIIRDGDAKIQSVAATDESADRSDVLPPTNGYLDRVTVGPFESVGEGRRHVQRITGQINEGGGVMVSTQPGRMTKSSELEAEVRLAKEVGAVGCTFYNYGLLREEQLGFIGSALR